MKKINIRRFATPLIIGAGVISAITGLLFPSTSRLRLTCNKDSMKVKVSSP